MDDSQLFAVILAGGSGTRFWPKSRQLKPKQLCSIGDNKESMLETTLRRLDGWIEPNQRIIVTHKDQLPPTNDCLGLASGSSNHQGLQILGEPTAKNTAPALALASLEIAARSGEDSIMVSLHADAVIRRPDALRNSLEKAIQLAEQDYLTLVGITPSHPETGYGYIAIGDAIEDTGFKVSGFHEKPDAATASDYVKRGMVWNSGIFVWKVKKILEEFRAWQPETIGTMEQALGSCTSFNQVDPKKFAAAYESLKSEAIDTAILEKSQNIAVVASDCGWQDVGSWDALQQVFTTDENGNLSYGDNLLLDCEGTTVDSEGLLVAAMGLKDMVVVVHQGAVLVCPKDKAQDVKKIVAQLKESKRDHLC